MEKRTKMKKTLQIAIFWKVFGCQGIENIANTSKTSVLDRLYAKKRVNYGVFDGKHCNNMEKKTMFLKDFLYIYLSWPAALAHGKIEKTSVNSGVFKGLGRQGNWKHCQKLCFGTLLWWQMCKLPCFEGKHCKTCKHTSKNTGFGEFYGKKCRWRCKMSFGQFFWASSSWLFEIP